MPGKGLLPFCPPLHTWAATSATFLEKDALLVYKKQALALYNANPRRRTLRPRLGHRPRHAASMPLWRLE
eukprot:37297-Chlamydomonas_euryale.AAC.1